MEYIDFLHELVELDAKLVESVISGYSSVFETITEPMEILKGSVSYEDKSLGNKLGPYLKFTGKSIKAVTDELELIRSQWDWFGEKFVDEGAEIDLGEDYPYDIDYESIDMDQVMDFMNEHPNRVANALSWFQRNIDGDHTSQLMDYEKPLINKWFVHFSNNARNIFDSGFKYGNEDVGKLSLTNAGETRGKNGSYLFAYEMDDVSQYAKSSRGNKFKYGDSAVVFVASGIKFYHHGDEEPQVVFDKNSPKGCFLIELDDSDRWCVYGHTPIYRKRLISVDKFNDAIYWCRENAEQYRRFYAWN